MVSGWLVFIVLLGILSNTGHLWVKEKMHISEKPTSKAICSSGIMCYLGHEQCTWMWLSNNGSFKDDNNRCLVFTLISFHGTWTSTRRLFSLSLGTGYILTIAGFKIIPFSSQCSNLPRGDIQSPQIFTRTCFGKHFMWLPSYHCWYIEYL